MEVIFLIILSVGLAVAVVILRTKLIVTKRISASLCKGIAKERGATADILRLSRSVIASQSREQDFLPSFIKYTIRSLKATGGAILLCGEDNYFYGCAVSGIFPPLKDVGPQIESQLLGHDKRHTEFIRGFKTKFTASGLETLCGSKGYAFFDKEGPEFFPPNFVKEAPLSVIVPIKVENNVYGCIIVTSKNDFDSHVLCPNDGIYLIRLAQVAALCIEVIKEFRKRQEYEQQLQLAREEGMTQVSSGIIHNIGNAITISKLAVTGLVKSFDIKTADRPENLILQTIIPRLEKELEEGNLNKFVKNDPQGKEYFSIIKELVAHMKKSSTESFKMLNSLSEKLFHISEIVELQQRFVGELGTENMTKLSQVIEESITIFDESFNKYGYKINAKLDKNIPEVLVDSSMLTQVFINFIKNAIEAMSSEENTSKKYKLDISLKSKKRDDKNYAHITIKDNGPGIPDDIKDEVFNFGFSTKTGENSSSRGIGLHFSKDCIKKYGGFIEMSSKAGKGCSFEIYIPIAKQD